MGKSHSWKVRSRFLTADVRPGLTLHSKGDWVRLQMFEFIILAQLIVLYPCNRALWTVHLCFVWLKTGSLTLLIVVSDCKKETLV